MSGKLIPFRRPGELPGPATMPGPITPRARPYIVLAPWHGEGHSIWYVADSETGDILASHRTPEAAYAQADAMNRARAAMLTESEDDQ